MTFEKNGFDFESLQVDLVFLIIKKAFLTQNLLNIYIYIYKKTLMSTETNH
jgi:hypothetical protein